MGGSTFNSAGNGTSPQDAFDILVAKAQYDHGHSGYTGTIAECDGFVVFECPDGVGPALFIRWVEASWGADKDAVPEDFHAIVRDARAIYEDKWGPALCIPDPTDNTLFHFIGSASA
jgi:hypothetical protein